MSDEYEYGPWVGWNGGRCPLADSDLVQVCFLTNKGNGEAEAPLPEPAEAWDWRGDCVEPIIAYRIATPKPKRELVVGKWYYAAASQVWRRVIAVSDDGVWLEGSDYPRTATCWARHKALSIIDWSTPPRDEAPE